MTVNGERNRDSSDGISATWPVTTRRCARSSPSFARQSGPCRSSGFSLTPSGSVPLAPPAAAVELAAAAAAVELAAAAAPLALRARSRVRPPSTKWTSR